MIAELSLILVISHVRKDVWVINDQSDHRSGLKTIINKIHSDMNEVKFIQSDFPAIKNFQAEKTNAFTVYALTPIVVSIKIAK